MLPEAILWGSELGGIDFTQFFLRFSFFFYFYLFLTVLGLVAVRDFSSCGERSPLRLQSVGFLFRWFVWSGSTGCRCKGFGSCGGRLRTRGSGALEPRPGSCGPRAWSLCIVWNLPGPGTGSVCPAWVGVSWPLSHQGRSYAIFFCFFETWSFILFTKYLPETYRWNSNSKYFTYLIPHKGVIL